MKILQIKGNCGFQAELILRGKWGEVLRGKLLSLADLAQKEKKGLYIVGGFVRDALRNIQSRDVDLVVSEEAEHFAKRVAWRMRGEYELLDSHSQYSRISLTTADGCPFAVDISLQQGKTLVEDLRCRDFTVNAMAVSLYDYLHDPAWQEKIIDPCGGKEDLANGVLRLTTEDCICADPVRIFRSARFLLRFGLQYAPETIVALQLNAGQIRNAQKMKLSLELFQLLNQPYAAAGLEILQDKLGVLAHVFEPFARMSQVFVDGEALFTHGLQTCRALETILHAEQCLSLELRGALGTHLRQTVSEGHNRLSFLRLACVLHDIGKVDEVGLTQAKKSFNHEIAAETYMCSLARRLCFSEAEEAYVTRMICNHSRPLYTESTPGSKVRFFRQFGDMVPELILLSMANTLSRAGTDSEHYHQLCRLLGDFYRGNYTKLPEPIISAREIMEFFNLPPTRLIGKCLEDVYIAQLEGRVKSNREALTMVSILLEVCNEGTENNR